MKEILKVIMDGDGDGLTVESEGPLLYLDSTADGGCAVAFTRSKARQLRTLLDQFIGEPADAGLSAKDARRLRLLLWLNHGCDAVGRYSDDGEHSCGQCAIDFRRAPIDQIEAKLLKRGTKRLEDALHQQYQLTAPSLGARTLDQLSDAELRVALDALGVELLRRQSSPAVLVT